LGGLYAIPCLDRRFRFGVAVPPTGVVPARNGFGYSAQANIYCTMMTEKPSIMKKGILAGGK